MVRRWSRRAFLRASVAVAGVAALPVGPARAGSPPALNRAARVFLDRGLFIGAWVPRTGRYFPNAAQWRDSACNAATFYEPDFYPGTLPAAQWALARYPAGDLTEPESGQRVLSGAAARHADTLFTICFGSDAPYDEQVVDWLADWFALTHAQHPDVLVHSDQLAGDWSEQQLRSYVRRAKPDLLTFDARNLGLPDIYDVLAIYRKVALEGHDGTGSAPIAFGHYAAGFAGGSYVPSESELNLDCFAAWTMGARWTTLFQWADGGTHLSRFGQLARIAREGRRLSPFLVRLSSTDVRIVPGRHLDGSGAPTGNPRPRNVPVWDSFASPYIAGISASGIPADILIGYFRPVPGAASDLPPTAARQFTEKYVKPFMLLNGGAAPNTSAADLTQQITVSLHRFGGDNRLLRVDRGSGRLEPIALQRSGSTDEFTVSIEGGAADLFFLTTGPTYDQPPTVTAAADRRVIAPGDEFRVTVTATNDTADQRMPDVQARILAPPGWSTDPDGSIRLGDLRPGSAGTTWWRVTAPTSVAAGNFVLTAEITYQYGPATDVRGGARAHAIVPIAYTALADDFRNVGTTDDSAPTDGDFDGAGNSYSAQALAIAGLTPGGPVTADGITFTWPESAAGQPDNALAIGQAVMLGRSGTTLGFLGCCTHGAGNGAGRIIYSDGSEQLYDLAYPDWFGTPPADAHVAVQMTYRNSSGGEDSNRVNVYVATVDIDATKTVDTVILPRLSADVRAGNAAMHIFAISTA